MRCVLRDGALFAAAVLLVAVPPAVGRVMPPPDLDPARYSSPSGRYVLHVDPTERNGAGPADCRLESAGETIWEKRLPFTFREAVVSDAGLSCGYAYTEGRGQLEGGELVVAMVDSSGEVVMREGHARERVREHQPDGPVCVGLHLLPRGRQVTARVRTDGSTSSELWWVYDLDRRARACTVPMKSTVAGGDDYYGTLALRPVTGTPLLLVQWRRHYGTGFTLFDENFVPVWCLSLPSDYSAAGTREVPLPYAAMRGGKGIPPSAPGTFTIWHFADRELVTYSAALEDAQWRIEELERRPREWPDRIERPPRDPGDPTPIELAPLGAILLGVESGAPQERWVAWHPVGEGIEGLRGSIAAELEWTQVDRRGESSSRIPISLPRDLEMAQVHGCRLADGRWIVILSHGPTQVCRAWAFDPGTGGLHELPAFDCPRVAVVAADLEGGFVVGYRSRVAAYDSEGRRRWRKTVKDPWGIAVTSGGEVVVLEDNAYELRFFSGSGRRLRRMDLEEACGQAVTWQRGLEALPGGGFLLRDLGDDPALWVVDEAGECATAVCPRFPDGHAPLELIRLARCASDGSLWSRAEGAFARLRADGVVDLVVGERAPEERIHAPSGARCGLDGRLYVFDVRTGVVHVFDRFGEPRHRCVPAANDYRTPCLRPHLAIDSSGRVFASRTSSHVEYVHYDSWGQRVALQEIPGTHLTFPRDSRKPWVQRHDGVARLAPDGSVAFTLERHADRTWIRRPPKIAARSDGGLLLYARRITIRDPEGELRSLDRLPLRLWFVDEVVCGGGWTASVNREQEVFLVRESDGAAYRCELPGIRPEARFDLTTPPDGSELWIFDRERLAFLRYAWPEE